MHKIEYLDWIYLARSSKSSISRVIWSFGVMVIELTRRIPRLGSETASQVKAMARTEGESNVMPQHFRRHGVPNQARTLHVDD
jgi:hypothetical protein